MTRAAAGYRVIFFEEPEFAGTTELFLRKTESAEGVLVVTPMLPSAVSDTDTNMAQQALLQELLFQLDAPVSIAWFYTPLALGFARNIRAKVIVYDCMDELSNFRGASDKLVPLERQLLEQATVVFAGGASLYEAKRTLHRSVHLFRSSVDVDHFATARRGPADMTEPDDQRGLSRPRIGFFGVIDERMDLQLVDALALSRPAWQFIMIGPTAKIDLASLPKRPNLHWLGLKTYQALPHYLAGWDAGFMPFAHNDATRFISPTKTPEFLAAGLPVVSTGIADVVRDWGIDGLVHVADDAAEMAASIETMLATDRRPWLERVDARLASLSWDATWVAMERLLRLSMGQATPVQNAATAMAT
ncbi:MAG: glycosyltransferase [Acetobacteraceae bacterium]|nr:glycosyltransferase [Acetobacteraceae bacterium]